MISTELLKDPEAESLSLHQRLDLHFSHITPTPSVLLQVLNQSSKAGRITVLGFHQWISSHPGFNPDDLTFSYIVDFFGKRKDFNAIHDVLVDGRGVTGPKTLASSIDRLVRAGMATEAVGFFEKMEQEYGFVRDHESLRMVVSALCKHGFVSNAEKMVKELAHEFIPDETICELLIKPWCVDGKLDEAKRLAVEFGTTGYNSFLECLLKLCRGNKDPSGRLRSEADKVLGDMDSAGVVPNVETFNVLMSNFGEMGRTEEAMQLFKRMGEWGCSPDETSYCILARNVMREIN